MKLKLDMVRIDAGTQQRPFDDDVIAKYMSLLKEQIESKEKIKFPPVEIVSDGNEYWLWDGFHRYYCYSKLGITGIEANITKGTLRDAIWLSFSANKAHGFQRQKGIAKRIIKQILTDPSWSETSLSAIAQHVGVTQQYVSQVKDEMSAHGTSTCTIDPDIDTENADFDNKPARKPVIRSDKIEVKRDDTIYTQKSQEKEQKEDKSVTDKEDKSVTDNVGRPIPEHLIETWEGRSVIQELIRSLSHIKAEVVKNLDNCNPAFSRLNGSRFQTEYGNLQRLLKFAAPYAVCVYCGGKDSENCAACKGFGFLNKVDYDAAPGELKL